MASIKRLEEVSQWFSELKDGWKELLFNAYSDDNSRRGYRNYGSGCVKLQLIWVFIYVILLVVIWLITKDFDKANELSIKIILPLFAFQFIGYFIVFLIDDTLKSILRKKKEKVNSSHSFVR